MAGSKKKRTKGRQKSKAALESARMKAEQAGLPEGSTAAPPEYSGGMMSNLRGGFQSAVGQGEAKGKGSTLNSILWIALIGAAVFLLVRNL